MKTNDINSNEEKDLEFIIKVHAGETEGYVVYARKRLAEIKASKTFSRNPSELARMEEENNA